MNRTRLTLVATGIIAPLILAAEQKSPTTKPDFNSTYGVVSERNMFLRERRAPRPANTNRNTTPREDTNSPQARERQMVLRGVTIEDNELHAYLENTRDNQIVRVAPGDKLVNGTVVEIAIDAIAYSVDTKTAWIEVGQNLAGVHTAAGPGTDSNNRGGDRNGPPSQSAGGSSSGGTPAAPPTPLPAEGGSIEERMKARRAAERGGK